MIEWYRPDRSLDSAIADAIDLYADERRDYWAEAEQERELVDGLASWLVDASEQPYPDLDDDSDGEATDFGRLILGLAANPEAESAVRERMQLRLAWKLLPKTEKMADRALELAREVLSERPNQVAVDYIRRLTRCYIAGFFPETVILCRAVIEWALNDAFEKAGISVPVGEDGESALMTKIKAAKRFPVLSDEAVERAHLVRTRGNKAVHNSPKDVEHVHETMRLTFSVLGEIYG
jgi:hypothetical protein